MIFADRPRRALRSDIGVNPHWRRADHRLRPNLRAWSHLRKEANPFGFGRTDGGKEPFRSVERAMSVTVGEGFLMSVSIAYNLQFTNQRTLKLSQNSAENAGPPINHDAEECLHIEVDRTRFGGLPRRETTAGFPQPTLSKGGTKPLLDERAQPKSDDSSARPTFSLLLLSIP